MKKLSKKPKMEDFVPTRCARLKRNVQDNFVSVEYTSYKKKELDPNNLKNRLNRSSINAANDAEKDKQQSIDPNKRQELEMKKARFEVIKFGMSGLKDVEAHRAKVAAAVALGARPPKKRRLNYKKLKEIQDKAKTKEKKKARASGADCSLMKRKPKRVRKVHKDSGILGVYGKVRKGGDS